MFKKIFISFLFSLVTYFGFAQYPNSFPLSGSAPTTRQTSLGGLSPSMIQVSNYTDTSAANTTGKVNKYPGSTIFTLSDNNYWTRNSTATEWIKITNPTSAIPCAGLIFGGVVTWNVNLNFLVTSAFYCINNTAYSSAAGNVTLSAADPSLPRIDVIAVNTAGAIVAITGTPNANPAKPQVDPFTQLELTSILVPAGATSPSPPLTRTIIYNENLGQPTEWTPASVLLTGTANFGNTTFPYIGTKDCLVSDSAAGAITFTTADTLSPSNYDVWQMFIRLSNTYPANANISAQFTFEGNPVSNLVPLNNTNGFQKNVIAAYQNISISMADFAFTSTMFNGLTIRLSGKGASFIFDYVQLQSGIIPPISDLDKRYWKLFQNDTTYASNKYMANDTFHLINLLGNTNRVAPSSTLEWNTTAFDTINNVFIPVKAWENIGVTTGNATPKFSWFLKMKGGAIDFIPLTVNSDKTMNFGTGINFLDNRVISATNTITVAPNTSNTGVRIANPSNPLVSGQTWTEIDPSGSVSSINSNVLRVKGDLSDSTLTVWPNGRLSVGRSLKYADFTTNERGRYWRGDTVNTTNRNGIVWNVTGTTIVNGGSGMVRGTPSASIVNPLGGRVVRLSVTVTAGVVSAIAITDPGSSQFTSGSIVFDTTNCTIGVGNVLPIATFSVTQGSFDIGAMLFNKDSACYQSWNGSSWDNMREGSGGGGSVGTWQESLDAGSTLNKDNTITNGAHTFTFNSNDGTDASTIITNSNSFTASITGGVGTGSVLQAAVDHAAIYFAQSGNLNQLLINSTGTFFESTIDGAGIQYNLDYSAGYTNRSLVDKEYVDTHGGGSGTVTSVSGTTNRITVSSPTTTPVIDISASYVGQTSITTLGTVTTGTITTGAVLGDVTTNLTGTDATGDIYYRNSSGILTRLAVGGAGQHLVGGTLPHWVDTATAGGGGTPDTLKFNALQFHFRSLTANKDSAYIVGTPSGIFFAGSDSTLITDPSLSWDGTVFKAGTVAGNGAGFTSNDGTGISEMGDWQALSGGFRIKVNSDGGTRTLDMGDVNNTFNGTKIQLDDVAQTVTVTAANGMTVPFLNSDGINAAAPSGVNNTVKSDKLTKLGDVDGSTNITLEGNGASDNITYNSANGHLFNGSAVTMSFYGAGAATFDAGGNITSVSDERLKKIIGYDKTGLKAIMKIKPILYKWNGNGKEKHEMDSTYAGFSAQNVKAAIPYGTGVNKDGYLSLQDRAIMAALVNGMQEQQKQIEGLKKEIKKLKKKK